MKNQLLLPAPEWWIREQEDTGKAAQCLSEHIDQEIMNKFLEREAIYEDAEMDRAKDLASKMIEAFAKILYGNYHMFPDTPGRLPVKILDLKIEVRNTPNTFYRPTLFIQMMVECTRVVKYCAFGIDPPKVMLMRFGIDRMAGRLIQQAASQVSFSRVLDLVEGIDDKLPRCPVCASRSFWHVDHILRKCDRCGYRGNVHNFFFRRKHASKVKPATLSRLATSGQLGSFPASAVHDQGGKEN